MEAYAAAKARDLRQPDARRLGGRERRRRAGRAAGRVEPARAACATGCRSHRRRRHGGRRRRSSSGTSASATPLVPLSAVRVPGRHMLSDVRRRRGDQPHSPAPRPTAMHARGRRLHRPRARDGTRRRRSAACASSTTRRRPTSMSARAVDRERASSLVVDPRRALQGRRLRDLLAAPLTDAARGGGRDRRGAPLIEAALADVVPRRRARRRWPMPCARRSGWRRRTARCCSRRRVRASTCSATTRSAGARSRRRCGGSREERRADA